MGRTLADCLTLYSFDDTGEDFAFESTPCNRTLSGDHKGAAMVSGGLPADRALSGLRSFSPEAEVWAKEWSNYAEAPLPWTEDRSIRVSNSGEKAFYVVAEPFRGYAKPLSAAKKDPHKFPIAATEKVASDLAYISRLPVPPVTLFYRRSAPDGEPRHHCVSAVPFPQVLQWGDLPEALRASIRPLTSPCMSAMIAFDTWVECNDHRENPGNLLLEIKKTSQVKVSLAFIDYTFSMVHLWKDNGYKRNFVAKPYCDKVNVDSGALRATIDMIESIPDAEVRRIVSRVPSVFLSDEHKQLMIDGLLYRKQSMRFWIAAKFPGVDA